jgi:hypothetical protein
VAKEWRKTWGEFFNLVSPHLSGVPLVVAEGESLDPVDAGFLGADGVVLGAHGIADAIQKFPLAASGHCFPLGTVSFPQEIDRFDAIRLNSEREAGLSLAEGRLSSFSAQGPWGSSADGPRMIFVCVQDQQVEIPGLRIHCPAENKH